MVSFKILSRFPFKIRVNFKKTPDALKLPHCPRIINKINLSKNVLAEALFPQKAINLKFLLWLIDESIFRIKLFSSAIWQILFSTSVELESDNVYVYICVSVYLYVPKLWGALEASKIVGFG